MSELVNALIKEIENQKPLLKHNEDLLCILEGDLMRFIIAHFKAEFKESDSVHQITPRIAPINFLKRIIDKLSKIYQEAPRRAIVDGTDADKEMLEWYLESCEWDSVLNVGNEFFNSFKYNLNQIYAFQGKPKLRPIPNDRFVVYSNNLVDPCVPTHFILPAGKRTKYNRAKQAYDVELFICWSASEVFMFDLEGDVMPYLDSGEYENPYDGAMPFMYVNRSRNFLVPPPDSDTKQMSILLPALISDLSYAVKFQSFSIIYGIDLDDQNIVMKPNGFWTFKSDPASEKTPSLGQLKPQVDITQVVDFITTQLSMWLNSRNIRPGSVGELTAENMTSGISKIVDEMDTSDDRKKQVEHYRVAEETFWQNIMHKIHPAWVSSGMLNETRLFSPNAYVTVDFAPQLPLQKRGELVRDLIEEVNAGFLSKESAMMKLNPKWTEEELQAELLKINSQFEISLTSNEASEDDGDAMAES